MSFWRSAWIGVKRDLLLTGIDVLALAASIGIGMAFGYRHYHGVQSWTGFGTGVVFGGMISFLFHSAGRYVAETGRSCWKTWKP